MPIAKMSLWIELERCSIKLDNCLSINFSPLSVSETRIRTHYLLIVKFLSCHSTTSSNQLLFLVVLVKKIPVNSKISFWFIHGSLEKRTINLTIGMTFVSHFSKEQKEIWMGFVFHTSNFFSSRRQVFNLFWLRRFHNLNSYKLKIHRRIGLILSHFYQ